MSDHEEEKVLTGRNAKNSMLLWNDGTDQVAIVPWPCNGQGSEYANSALGCYSYIKTMSFLQRKAIVFIEAMHLIVRDKCDPMAVHKALLNLDEYVDGCAKDMPLMTQEMREFTEEGIF